MFSTYEDDRKRKARLPDEVFARNTTMGISAVMGNPHFTIGIQKLSILSHGLTWRILRPHDWTGTARIGLDEVIGRLLVADSMPTLRVQSYRPLDPESPHVSSVQRILCGSCSTGMTLHPSWKGG